MKNMKNIATHFANFSSVESLRNPFEVVQPQLYPDLPTYLRSLSAELLQYHPSIKTTMTVTIDGDHVDITITMKN